MNALDLYGRNPDFQSTTFAYPYPLVADTPPAPGKRFFFKPPESNPVFGVEQIHTPDAEDNIVLLDPTNSRYTSQRERGGLYGYSIEGMSPFDEINTMQGLAGVTPNHVSMGLAGDLGLGEDADRMTDILARARAPFKQTNAVAAQKRAEAKSAGWAAWDGIGGFYRRSSGVAQIAMLAVGGLILWNVFGGRRR